jgi:subtilisin-like proprotein convertase family protein
MIYVRGTTFPLVFSLAFVAACNGDDDGTSPPTTGSLEVTTSTTGDDLDPDGYTVTVDGGTSQSVGINGSTAFAQVATGDREVELTGLAANCSVTGVNPRTVTVAGGGTASTSFDVPCFALTQTFSSVSAITLPDGAPATTSGPADPYPSTIDVAGILDGVTDVNVTIANLSHTFPDDLDILLVGPQGQSTWLMSDVGGSGDITNVTLTFDQSAEDALPDASQISGGTFTPTNIVENDIMAPPAPGGPYAVTLEVFNGTDPNGTWSLYIIDDVGADVGSAGGWSLEITALASGTP